MRRLAWSAVLGVALAAAQGAGDAQQGGMQGVPSASQQSGSPTHPKLSDGASEIPASTQERMAVERSTERQRLLVSDTDKLVELALALKKDVARTDKNMLSLDVVKRAEQIEKLARSVKEREKGTK